MRTQRVFTLAHAQLRPILSSGLGLTGQVFTFLALLLPIAFKMHSALAAFVVGASIATALVLAALVSAHVLIPVQRSLHAVKVSLTASLSMLAIVVVVTYAVGPIVSQILHVEASVVYLASIQLLVQGLQTVALALLVRFGNYRAVGRSRLVYGAASVTLTLAACLFFRHSVLVLLQASIIAFVITAVFTAAQERRNLLDVWRAERVRPVQVFRYWWTSKALVASSALDGASSQALGLVLVKAGPLTSGWAIVTRVGGGFSTVAQQLIAPVWDIRFSDSVRDERSRDAWLISRRALSSAVVLATGTVVIAIVLACLSGAFVPLDSTATLVLIVSALAYWGSTIATSVVYKHLAMSGASHLQAGWALIRAGLVVGSVIVVPGYAAILAASVATLLLMVAYVLLLRSYLLKGTRSVENS